MEKKAIQEVELQELVTDEYYSENVGGIGWMVVWFTELETLAWKL